jgi:outer membrane protein TolC
MKDTVTACLLTVPRLLASVLVAFTLPAVGAEAPALRSLSIKDAVQLALEQNPRRLIAALAVRQGRENQTIARAALLPQAFVRAAQGVRSYNVQTVTEAPHPSRVGPFQTIEAGPAASVGFSLTRFRQYQARREDVKAAILDETTVREQITAEVVTQYLLVLRATADKEAAVARVDLAQRLYDQARQVQQAGVGTDIDALRAQVELQNEKQRLIDATTERNTSIYALAESVALPRGEEPAPTDAMEFYELPEFGAESLTTQALQNRPEIRSLLCAERAAASRVQAAGAQRLPDLQWSGFYDYQARQLENGIGGYGYSFALSVPVWTSGQIGAEEQRARLERERIEQMRRDVENAVARQVQTALAQLRAARQAVEVAQLGLTLARQEVERAGRRFEAGVATNIEVITAQSALARADDNRIAALYQFNQARADLARSVGNAEDVYGH